MNTLLTDCCERNESRVGVSPAARCDGLNRTSSVAMLSPEERLRQSEERLRAITESARDAIVMMDAQGRISYWNPAATRILGYESTEVVGRDLHQLIAPARFHPACQAAMSVFRESGKGAALGRTVDVEARRKDGREISVQLSLSAVRMDDGWHAVGIIRDITDSKRAEREMQRQAAFARFNPNPVLEFSADGEITYANQAFAEMARALDLDDPPLMLPPHATEVVQTCLASGEPRLRIEITLGSRVLSWSFFPVASLQTVHAYGGDITERKRMEDALRRSETKFRTLYEASSDAVMLINPQGYFDCNSAALAMFGCASKEELLSKHPADFSPARQPDGSDSRAAAEDRIATALKQGSLQFEWVHQRADTGLVFPVEVRLSAMELDGQPMLQALVHNIALRKRSEDRLRQLSAAVEQCPASIVITNPAGEIEYVNPKFLQLTGYTLAEVLGQNPRILKSGEIKPEAYRELWQTITVGKTWRGEFHNKAKDGQLYWESASISPIRDRDGRITHFVAVKEDITARKETEAQREDLIKSLEEALANVKSLSGLLPICAGCKQIRDDQGYWTQVESYIQKHSEAKFSHGLCPDCIKKYFQELGEPYPGPDEPEGPRSS